ncbi:hypothetical protein MHB63_15310 [Bacillus sp. FSL H8-0547]
MELDITEKRNRHNVYPDYALELTSASLKGTFLLGFRPSAIIKHLKGSIHFSLLPFIIPKQKKESSIPASLHHMQYPAY